MGLCWLLEAKDRAKGKRDRTTGGSENSLQPLTHHERVYEEVVPSKREESSWVRMLFLLRGSSRPLHICANGC